MDAVDAVIVSGGEGYWQVHSARATDRLVGTIQRTSNGFEARDALGNDLGIAYNLPDAVALIVAAFVRPSR